MLHNQSTNLTNLFRRPILHLILFAEQNIGPIRQMIAHSTTTSGGMC